MFSVTSRYRALDSATLQIGENRILVYVRRRFLPQPDDLALLREHVVIPGERLDIIAAAYLGDPEQFWQIADANGAMKPDDLTSTPGRRLRITLPAGIPGTPNAR